MSVEDYRASYEAEVAAELAASPDDPLTAGRTAGAEPARSSGEAGAAVGDRDADPTGRIAAIDAARLDAISRPEVVQALVAVLADDGDDPAVRHAALGALEELSFAVTAFAPYAAGYRAALRAAATAEDPALREAALEILALAHDEHAQQLLVEGLRNPDAALVARTRALQFLGYDLHAGHYDLLREIAEGSGDPVERSAAVRLLGGDAGSAELLHRLLRDRGEDVSVRTMSAAALNAIEPAEFAPVAREIALDPDEADELRTTCLTALTVAPDDDEPELADQVMTATPTPSAELERAAQQYRDVKGPR